MNYPIRTLQQLRPLLVGLRKQAGLSQAEVAARLGVTQQSYAKIEANPAATSVERLFTILRLLGGEIVLGQAESADGRKEVWGVPALSPTATASAFVAKPKKATAPAFASKPKKATVAAPARVMPPSKQTEDW